MDFIQTANKQVDKFGVGKHGFSAGNPSGGVLATLLSNAWCDSVQQEIINTIEAGGIVPSGADLAQMRKAISRRYGGAIRSVAAGITNLTVDDSGVVIVDAAAGNVTINLWLANVLATSRVLFRRVDNTSNTVTINRAGADTFDEAGATSFTLLSRGDVREVVADGGATWRSVNGPNSALRANIGYQRLPSGLIIQWGSGTSVTGNNDTVTLPIAFPNLFHQAWVSEGNATGWGGTPNPTVHGVTLTAALGSFGASAVRLDSAGNVSYQTGISYRWLAIGS